MEKLIDKLMSTKVFRCILLLIPNIIIICLVTLLTAWLVVRITSSANVYAFAISGSVGIGVMIWTLIWAIKIRSYGQVRIPELHTSPTGKSEPVPAKNSHKASAVDGYENAVFVSYAWEDESDHTVDELEKAFNKRNISIVRDKKDINYKDLIEQFEQRLARGQCIILVISDKYLRSEHCMYELLEVDKNQNMWARIFPIVLPDAYIYRSPDRLEYSQYWEKQIKELEQKIRQSSTLANLGVSQAALDKYTRIRANFDRLAGVIGNMNTLTPEMLAAQDFSVLINSVEQARSIKK